MRGTARISSWARAAMSEETWRLADRLRLVVVADGRESSGPWIVRHPRLIEELRGADVDALVSHAAAEVMA